MFNRLPMAALAALLISAGAAGAGDVEAGQSLYRDACRQCHGPTAKGVGSFPKLAGYSAEHLSGRLAQYRAGERVGPNSALMAPAARRLTDEEIANLAAFIAGLNLSGTRGRAAGPGTPACRRRSRSGPTLRTGRDAGPRPVRSARGRGRCAGAAGGRRRKSE